MKRSLRIAAAFCCAAVFVMLFSGCRLFPNGGDFVLKADRYYIQPTGSDDPTLFFYDKDGNEIKATSVTVYADGERCPRRRVTSTEEGKLTVYAEYQGMRSNTIFIEAAYNSDLPVIIVETGKKRVNQAFPVEGSFSLYDVGKDGVTLYGGNCKPDVVSPCTINIRGQSSALIYDKKQYKIHLQNEDGSNNNVSLLGMPAENDWIINGTYGDTTVMHNYFVYTLESQMEFGWAPRVRFVEVYITSDKDNMDDNDYLGLYVLTESIKADGDRVDVTKGDRSTEPDQIGYIFKKDKGVERNEAINTSYDTYGIVYPNASEATRTQKQYLQGKIQEFEDTLYGDNFKDPFEGYRAYIDADSYIDTVLLTELTKNVDGVRLSTYFSLDAGGKIKSGPAWDFDISCGTCNYGMDLEKPEKFVCLDPNYRYPDRHEGNPDAYLWLDRMMEDEWFRARLVERYRMWRKTAFAEENIQTIIDATYHTAFSAATRNGTRWPKLYNGSELWPNPVHYHSYTDAVNGLKTWLHERLAWLDENIGWVSGEKDRY